MIELAPDIYYIEGENNSRFPYCACLYLTGKKLRVLIDAGMGARQLAPARKMGIDVLILTHCHIDHRLTRREISDVPVWCHAKDAIYLKNRELFFKAMGLKRSGLKLSPLFDVDPDVLEIPIDHELMEGEKIDLGGLTLETLHTPGHTPGHISFFIPEHRLLFSGDLDLTRFGPFYGHDFASIDDILSSIERLKRVNSKIVATGHAQPVSEGIPDRFDEYANVIHQRDQLVLDGLDEPRSLHAFEGRHLFYRVYPDFPELIRWFELVHIEKHLKRLQTMGKVCQKDGLWVKKNIGSGA